MNEINDTIGCVNHDCAKCRAVQEPVAWSVTWDGVHCGNFFFRAVDAIEYRERLSLKYPNEKREVVPLYTTPPEVQPAVPEGWKLVPVEPTNEMIEAGLEPDYEGMGCVCIYNAMLAAAPEKGQP